MDDATVLRRLDRVERLDRDGAPAGVLLAEVCALLSEAEAWARRHRGEEGERTSALAAVERARAALGEGRAPVHAR